MPCPCKRRELFTDHQNVVTSLDIGKLDGRYQRYMGNYQPYYDSSDEDDPYYYHSSYNPFAIQQQKQQQIITPMLTQTKTPTRMPKNSMFMCCICFILILIMAYLINKKLIFSS